MSNQLTSQQRARMQLHLQSQRGYENYTDTQAKRSWLDWIRDVGLTWLADQLITATWAGIKSWLKLHGIWIF